MKATIEHVQTATITAEATAQAVDIAADSAMLAAEQSVAKAARATVRAALEADPDWIEAQDLKAEMKKSTAGTREEIADLEDKAKERQAGTDAGRCLDGATMRVGKIKKAIARKLGECGQMLLPLYREDSAR
jgi:hypothetical protein